MSEAKKYPTRWQPGQSGNPNGRPSGTGEVAALRQSLKPCLPELLERVMLQALSGDTTAQRLILDRVLPSLKPQAAEISLALQEGSSLIDKGETILQAAVDGNVAPDVAAQLIAGLGQLGALKKVEELEDRLRALENPTTVKNQNVDKYLAAFDELATQQGPHHDLA